MTSPPFSLSNTNIKELVDSLNSLEDNGGDTQKVHLVFVDYFWGAPAAGRFDNGDRCTVVVAVAKGGSVGESVDMAVQNIDEDWVLVHLDAWGKEEGSIDSSVFDLFVWSSVIQSQFFTAFAVRLLQYDDNLPESWDNNNWQNYKLKSYVSKPQYVWGRDIPQNLQEKFSGSTPTA